MDINLRFSFGERSLGFRTPTALLSRPLFHFSGPHAKLPSRLTIDSLRVGWKFLCIRSSPTEQSTSENDVGVWQAREGAHP